MGWVEIAADRRVLDLKPFLEAGVGGCWLATWKRAASSPTISKKPRCSGRTPWFMTRNVYRGRSGSRVIFSERSPGIGPGTDSNVHHELTPDTVLGAVVEPDHVGLQRAAETPPYQRVDVSIAVHVPRATAAPRPLSRA